MSLTSCCFGCVGVFLARFQATPTGRASFHLLERLGCFLRRSHSCPRLPRRPAGGWRRIGRSRDPVADRPEAPRSTSADMTGAQVPVHGLGLVAPLRSPARRAKRRRVGGAVVAERVDVGGHDQLEGKAGEVGGAEREQFGSPVSAAPPWYRASVVGAAGRPRSLGRTRRCRRRPARGRSRPGRPASPRVAAASARAGDPSRALRGISAEGSGSRPRGSGLPGDRGRLRRHPAMTDARNMRRARSAIGQHQVGTPHVRSPSRSSRFITVDLCQRPPWRVSMPRALSSSAIAPRPTCPPARMSATTNARSRARRSALRPMAARSGAPPLPARRRAAAPLGLPSLTPRLGHGQRLLGSLRPPRGPAGPRHHPDGEVARLWQVHRREPHAAVAQRPQGGGVAREPVELGDDQRRRSDLRQVQRLAELRPVRAAAAHRPDGHIGRSRLCSAGPVLGEHRPLGHTGRSR